MAFNKVFHVIIFVFVALATAQVVTASEPLLLADLGKMKEISKAFHKELSLSDQLKEENNILSGEINGFIESVVVSVKRGFQTEKEKELYEEKRIKINGLVNAIYKKLRGDKRAQDKESLGEYTNKLGADLYLFKVEISSNAFNDLLEFMKSDESKAKEYYIQKLENKMWTAIS
jgi:hypothetical protein